MFTRGIVLATSCALAFGCAEQPPETKEIVDTLVQLGVPADDIKVVSDVVYVARGAEVSLAGSREICIDGSLPAGQRVLMGKDRARYLIVTSEGEEIVVKLNALPKPPAPPAPLATPAASAPGASTPESSGSCDCALRECDPMCLQVLQATDVQPVLSCTSR